MQKITVVTQSPEWLAAIQHALQVEGFQTEGYADLRHAVDEINQNPSERAMVITVAPDEYNEPMVAQFLSLIRPSKVSTLFLAGPRSSKSIQDLSNVVVERSRNFEPLIAQIKRLVGEA